MHAPLVWPDALMWSVIKGGHRPEVESTHRVTKTLISVVAAFSICNRIGWIHHHYSFKVHAHETITVYVKLADGKDYVDYCKDAAQNTASHQAKYANKECEGDILLVSKSNRNESRIKTY